MRNDRESSVEGFDYEDKHFVFNKTDMTDMGKAVTF